MAKQPKQHKPPQFQHPGVLVSLGQLEYAKRMFLAGQQPWLDAFQAMANSSLASLDYQPTPREIVECGSNSIPNYGCRDERNDALAAYTHALLWFFTDNMEHASKAIQIMDAWSSLLRDHNNTNALLQASWSGASFSRAAELIAHTFVVGQGKEAENGTRKSWANQNRFKHMLRNVFVPKIQSGIGCKNGNWELILASALAGIGVHLDDWPTFRRAIRIWRQRVPAYIYMSEDGPMPNSPVCSPKDVENCPSKDWLVCPENGTISDSERKSRLITYWAGQVTFVDGIAQETCRDFGHTGWGIHAASHVAETAWHQGIDLYTEQMERLVLSANFHSTFDIGAAQIPDWLCPNGTVKTGLGPVLEVLYNHYANRMALSSLPAVASHLSGRRPMGADYFYAWETLTHADNPN